MYRQLTVTHFSINNIKLITKKLLNNDPNQSIGIHRKYNHFVWNSLQHDSQILRRKYLGANVRVSSSQQINAETSSPKAAKRKQKHGRFVELLEVGLTTKQIKARVKSLKSKKLAEFIEKSDYLNNRYSGKFLLSQLSEEEKVQAKSDKKRDKLKKPSCKERLPRLQKFDFDSCKQPIEYQKFNIDMFDSNILENAEFDAKPLIFLGKDKMMQFSAEDQQRIISSFNKFKEIVENIKLEQELHRSSGTHFQLSKEIEEIESVDAIDGTEGEIEKLSMAKDSVKKAEKNQAFKSKHYRSLEQEKLAKHKTILINLSAYINVCISNGMLGPAFSTILVYREKCKKYETLKGFQPIPIDIYNILMHGHAKNGDLNKIENILRVLQEDNMQPNHQSFASIFECLGRVEESAENNKLLLRYKDKAAKLGILLNDIVDHSKFEYDELEIILDAIRRIEPDFEPHFTKPNLDYMNPLLTALNTHNEAADRTKMKEDYSSSHNILSSNCEYTQDQLLVFGKEQLQIELDGYVNIKSIEKSPDFPSSEEYRKKIEDLNVLWKTQICSAISRDLNALRAQIRYKPNGIMSYYAYLKTLDVKQYADILLQEIRKLAEGSESFSPTVSYLYKVLGQNVHAKYQIEMKKRNGILNKTGDIYYEYCNQLNRDSECYNSRQKWQDLIYRSRISGPSMDINEIAWPNNVLVGVGRFLYNILMRDIKIDANVLKSNQTNAKKNLLPAFYTLYRNHGRVVKEEIKPHPVLVRLVRASKQKMLSFSANQVPMMCPPQPWTTPVNGGYLLTKSDLIRLPYQAIQQLTRISDMKAEELYPALDSLNQLSSIPWRVNTDILDVILEVFRKGGDHKLDVPESPNNLPPLPSISKKNSKLSNTERSQLFKQKMVQKRKQAEMYSLWCDTLYRLSLANHYRDRVFWLPHNMDFRGRVYPLPPHLNHLGSDLARSMLLFDKKKPLGPDGFTWLKLHCINLTGMKKNNSISERILYAEKVMDDILDSAQNPLTGRMWWMKSDEPWQTLACCMEIAKVSKVEKPEEYLSGFPIHQDGSCNGLQHYAALGRDEAGAFSVNLSPSEVPQDVYSAIATLVEKARSTDASNGLHVAQILEGYIRRKVIKQTVMTTVYGVTRYGARLQIARQLKDIEDFPKEWVWPASTYLTTKTFESLREMFTSAKEIQDWFTDCAKYISSVCMQNVEWVTPLGLPVVQPYNRMEQYKSMKSLQINEKMPLDMYEKPNVMKQKNAFPPNFIHSLDSSHMMLTSLFCEKNDITFVSIHDCFWTHACTVPQMSKICREQFVALHSQPILEDLSKFMVEKYSFRESDLSIDGHITNASKLKLNEALTQVPKQGDFELKNVLKSIYFFS